MVFCFVFLSHLWKFYIINSRPDRSERRKWRTDLKCMRCIKIRIKKHLTKPTIHSSVLSVEEFHTESSPEGSHSHSHRSEAFQVRSMRKGYFTQKQTSRSTWEFTPVRNPSRASSAERASHRKASLRITSEFTPEKSRMCANSADGDSHKKASWTTTSEFTLLGTAFCLLTVRKEFLQRNP